MCLNIYVCIYRCIYRYVSIHLCIHIYVCCVCACVFQICICELLSCLPATSVSHFVCLLWFLFYFFASNMFICLSPCLSALGSLPAAVEIRGQGGGGGIVLLNARSPMRLGGRMRRLAGLQRSEVVWEQLLPDKKEKRTPALVDLCKSYMKKRP